MDHKPKTINLRDANQQFSKLVREVQESGREYVVLRNGKPVMKMSPMPETPRKLTPEQEEALARLLNPKNHFTLPEGYRFDRTEYWDEEVSRLTSAKRIAAREEAVAKGESKGRKRG
jgi:antitoxin (DNA-binding transcriptional repressor) of toxin-antitoxin stability system